MSVAYVPDKGVNLKELLSVLKPTLKGKALDKEALKYPGLPTCTWGRREYPGLAIQSQAAFLDVVNNPWAKNSWPRIGCQQVHARATGAIFCID